MATGLTRAVQRSRCGPGGAVRWAPANAMLWLTALVVAALAIRLALAWQPVDVLVAKLTPDDAYYYFQIAQNIAAGEGPTLDGEHATNGFHPLWLAILLPFARMQDDSFLRAALMLRRGHRFRRYRCAVVGSVRAFRAWIAANA